MTQTSHTQKVYFFDPLTSDDSADVFIIDDSLYERAGYKCTQMASIKNILHITDEQVEEIYKDFFFRLPEYMQDALKCIFG